MSTLPLIHASLHPGATYRGHWPAAKQVEVEIACLCDGHPVLCGPGVEGHVAADGLCGLGVNVVGINARDAIQLQSANLRR